MSIQSMYNLKEEKASKQGVSTRILVNGSQIVEFLLKKNLLLSNFKQTLGLDNL